jgi:hypothetical protein
MRYNSPSFLVLVVASAQLVGCNRQAASDTATSSVTPVVVTVSRDGSFAYNGAPITVESLNRLLEKRGRLDGDPIPK